MDVCMYVCMYVACIMCHVDTVARREAYEVAAVAGQDAPVVRVDKGRKQLERRTAWNLADIC